MILKLEFRDQSRNLQKKVGSSEIKIAILKKMSEFWDLVKISKKVEISRIKSNLLEKGCSSEIKIGIPSLKSKGREKKVKFWDKV